jgi:hypothetical protein
MNDLAQQPDPASATRSSSAGPAAIVVAYHFYPSPEIGARRMSALARLLQARGWTVAVVSALAGLACGGAQDPARAALAAYDVEHVPDRTSAVVAFLVSTKRLLRRVTGHPAAASAAGDRAPAAGTSAFHRVLFGVLRIVDDKKSWSWRAARKLEILARRHPAGVVIVSAPPISPLYCVARSARRLQLPLIVDLRDPVSDTATPDARRPFTRRWSTLRVLERYVIARAAAVVTTSAGLRDLLAARYPGARTRIVCIANGFDGHPSGRRTDTGHELVMVYAGELYLNRNPFPFLEAVNRLLARPGVDASRVRIVFAGECDSYRGVSLRGWAATRPCGRVLAIHPRLDSSKLKPIYQQATLLLNFAEGQPIQVPAKTFELLTLGREILVMCEPHSDTARIIRGLDGVFGVYSADSAQLDELLGTLYRRHVVAGHMSPPAASSVMRYSRAIQNERYATLIDDIRLGKLPVAVDPAHHGN